MYVHPVLVKVLVPLDQDIAKIWSDLKHYGNSRDCSIHLIGSDRQYMIVYSGNLADAYLIDEYFYPIRGARIIAFTMDYSVALDPVTLLPL